MDKTGNLMWLYDPTMADIAAYIDRIPCLSEAVAFYNLPPMRVVGLCIDHGLLVPTLRRKKGYNILLFAHDYIDQIMESPLDSRWEAIPRVCMLLVCQLMFSEMNVFEHARDDELRRHG